jgi:RNA polymerase sigma-70 factor (ECF subfamily)
MNELRAANSAEPWSDFRERLYRFVRSRVPVESDAEDLVQIVLERALKTAAADEAESPTSWLYAVARNAIVDYYRASARSPRQADVDEALSIVEDAESPDQGRRMIAACMEPLLSSLDSETQQVLRWADVDDWSMQRIADELGMPVSSAKSRVQRGRRKLLTQLERCCKVSRDACGRPTDMERRPNAAVRCSGEGGKGGCG